MKTFAEISSDLLTSLLETEYQMNEKFRDSNKLWCCYFNHKGLAHHSAIFVCHQRGVSGVVISTTKPGSPFWHLCVPSGRPGSPFWHLCVPSGRSKWCYFNYKGLTHHSGIFVCHQPQQCLAHHSGIFVCHQDLLIQHYISLTGSESMLFFTNVSNMLFTILFTWDIFRSLL
ncbi:hypothetical protein PILCRDRAFT_92802 [Piloderma croceum F 1598]|uniref:Uncharacterized protein n=1 Tax=Piloderma croceum (strain F 1598) TaxID=765440 RepID=A0A0C3F1W8_PILCF|nr:hypothetical protein PILCRDRAFT_92802 [Piloderma croceum F 1598]